MVSGSTITIPAAGVYAFHAIGYFDANSTGMRMLHLRRNSESVNPVGGQIRSNALRAKDDVDNPKPVVVNLYHERECNVGDTFELYATQDSGGALTCRGGRNRTRFGVRYVGPTVSGGSIVIPKWQDSHPWNGRAVMPSSLNTYIRDRQRFLYNHRGSFYRLDMHSQDQATRENSRNVLDYNQYVALGTGVAEAPARSLTIDKGGRWRLWGFQDWQDMPGGSRYNRLDIDGEYDIELESHISPTGDWHSYRSWYLERDFGVGQRITPTLDQDSGGDLGVNAAYLGGGWMGEALTSPPWTPPRTWVDNEDVTLPALFDVELNDKGDNLLYLDNAYCEVRMDGSRDISYDNPVLLTWQAAPVNLGSMWSSANSSRIYIPLAGKYRLFGIARWQSENSGHRAIWYRKNGGATDYELDTRQATTSDVAGTVNNWYAEEEFDDGDYVELYARQTRGSALKLQANDTYFAVAMIGT